VWAQREYGDPFQLRFFYRELGQYLDLENLNYEAYILVSKLYFDYQSVKKMTRRERLDFIELFKQEQKALESK
jgi:hypothetical protein